MSTMKLEIVTPGGLVFEGDVEHVRAPGVEGSFGVLPGHTPFITPMEVGVIEVRAAGGEMKLYASSGGLADVGPEVVMLMAETAELSDKIDVERAKAAAARARKRIEDMGTEGTDLYRARQALARAENRMNIAAGKHI